MEKPIDVRTLDEWMYAIQNVLNELDTSAEAPEREHAALLMKVLDDMRERRAHLRLRRHNELGY